MGEFLVSGHFVEWWPIEGGCIHLCRFDRRHYSAERFDELGVGRFETVRRAVPERQAEYLAGRYSAGRVLARLGSASIEVGTGVHREPLWPEGVCGSISHSGPFALAAASSAAGIGGIGIDIESIPADPVERELVATVLSPIERGRLESLELPFATAFIVAFSLKECFFKAAYPRVGRYFGFEAVELLSLEPERGRAALRVREDLGRGLSEGRRVEGRWRRVTRTRVAGLVVLERAR